MTQDSARTRAILVSFEFADRPATDESRNPTKLCECVHLWPMDPHPLLCNSRDVDLCAIVSADFTLHTRHG